MGLMDKAKETLSGHKEQAETGIDKAGDHVDKRTDDKYDDKVDMGQEKARDQLDKM